MFCYYCMEPMSEGSQNCLVCGRAIYNDAALHHLKPGTKLYGKYLIGRVLGEGGFGITYIGRDLDLDIKVAIKEYYPKGFANRNVIADEGVTLTAKDTDDVYAKGKNRFLMEARTLAKFSREPNIVNVRDFFEANNTAYFVMDYISGCNLKEYIEKNGNIDPQELVDWFIPIMRVLGNVHKQGLIHRDISPDNIIVENGKLILIDFGASREVDTDKSLSVIHKPGYAPGEQQYSRGNQGPWTDVYALCATMYKCITGMKPPESSERIFEDKLVAPSKLGVSIPLHIEAAIMKGLSNRYQERQQNMEKLIEEIKLPQADNQPQATLSEPVNSIRINSVLYTESEEEDTKTVYEPKASSRPALQKKDRSFAPVEKDNDDAVTVCESKSKKTVSLVRPNTNPVPLMPVKPETPKSVPRPKTEKNSDTGDRNGAKPNVPKPNVLNKENLTTIVAGFEEDTKTVYEPKASSRPVLQKKDRSFAPVEQDNNDAVTVYESKTKKTVSLVRPNTNPVPLMHVKPETPKSVPRSKTEKNSDAGDRNGAKPNVLKPNVLNKKKLITIIAGFVAAILIIVAIVVVSGGVSTPSNQTVLDDIKKSGLISGMIVTFEVEDKYLDSENTYTAICNVETESTDSGLYSVSVTYDLVGKTWECRSVNVNSITSDTDGTFFNSK